jgi:hypothetical protein
MDFSGGLAAVPLFLFISASLARTPAVVGVVCPFAVPSILSVLFQKKIDQIKSADVCVQSL